MNNTVDSVDKAGEGQGILIDDASDYCDVLGNTVQNCDDGITIGTGTQIHDNSWQHSGGVYTLPHDYTVQTAGATTAIKIDNTAADGDPILGFALSGTNVFTMGVDDGDSDKLKIGTTAIGTNTRLTIDSSGNVGIGTASPAGKVDIIHGANEYGKIVLGAGNILGNPFGSAADPALYMFRWTGIGTNAKGYVLGIDTDKFTISYAGDATIGSHSWSPRITLDLSGNVGIGTTSPSDVLEVAGAVVREGFFQGVNGTAQTALDGSETAINFDKNPDTRIDTDYYTHDPTSNPEQITIDKAGWYRISYCISWDADKNDRQCFKAYVEDDGTPIVPSTSYCYIRFNTYGRFESNVATFIAEIAASSVLELHVEGQAGAGAFGAGCDNDTIADETWILIEKI